jgi:hypothetical protein
LRLSLVDEIRHNVEEPSETNPRAPSFSYPAAFKGFQRRWIVIQREQQSISALQVIVVNLHFVVGHGVYAEDQQPIFTLV